MTQRSTVLLKWLNLSAFVLTVAINALANLIPLGGVTTGGVSDAYPNLFTPIPATFAIWGAIYLLLAGFALYQAGLFDRFGVNGAQAVSRVGYWFVASCFFNMAWLFAWHYKQIGLSVLLMLGLLVTLIVLRQKTSGQNASKLEAWLLQAPFSLYSGWITVALMANVTVFLVKARWNGWGIPPQGWMVALLLIGLQIARTAILRDRDWVYGLALIWAYAGILLKHVLPSGFGGAYPWVIATAGLCELGLIATSVAAYRKRGR